MQAHVSISRRLGQDGLADPSLVKQRMRSPTVYPTPITILSIENTVNWGYVALLFDFDRQNFITLANGVNHVHILGLAKHGMHTIQVRLG